MTSTHPAPTPITVPNGTERDVARAAYGLVADEYAVIGHTPNLTRDEARELCLAVGVGDLTVTIDDAIAFVEIAEWGVVCTRYTTERDARGRVALASDSVAVDVETFAALRSDPFRCFPRRQDRPASTGALSVPRFSASTPAAEADRVADARRTVDDDALLRALLAALIGGNRVLYIAAEAPFPIAALQCVVLLMPPALRRHMTFQTIAAQAPRHAPRLTIADRRYADFGSVAWTAELPRRGAVADARADRVAASLLALSPMALGAAHSSYESLRADAHAASNDLLGEVERVARYGELSDAIARKDISAAMRQIGDDADTSETSRVSDALLEAFGADALGTSIGASLTSSTADITAATRVADQLARRVATGDASASEALRVALGVTDAARWPANDDGARALRTTLAVAAAWLGDAVRFARLAEAEMTWPSFVAEQRATSGACATALAALVKAADRDTDRSAHAIDALRTLAASEASARADLGALALSLARRAFEAHGGLGDGAALERVAYAIERFWSTAPPAHRDEALGRAVAWLGRRGGR